MDWGLLPHTLCFAVKSNGNLAILKHVAKLGNGFDIVSGGELSLLRHIGVRGDRIVFSGVGKTREEIREALAICSGQIGWAKCAAGDFALQCGVGGGAGGFAGGGSAGSWARRGAASRFDSSESGRAGWRASAYFYRTLRA